MYIDTLNLTTGARRGTKRKTIKVLLSGPSGASLGSPITEVAKIGFTTISKLSGAGSASERVLLMYAMMGGKRLCTVGIFAGNYSAFVARVIHVLTARETLADWSRSATVEAMHGVPFAFMTVRGASLLALAAETEPGLRKDLREFFLTLKNDSDARQNFKHF